MPKITDAQYVTGTNGTGYIVGYQDGVFCRWPVTMAVANKWLSGSGVPNVGTGVDDDYYLDIDTGDVYQKVEGFWGTAIANFKGADGTNGTNGTNGADGTNGIDGTDGVGVPVGGTTGQVLAKKSAGDYDCEWVEAESGSNGLIDLTSASSDYELVVGETAYITYSSATSILLHVAAVEGEYEIIVNGSSIATNPTDGDCWLLPNNTTYASAIRREQLSYVGASLSSSGMTDAAFNIGYAGLVKSIINICTITAGKHIECSNTFKINSGSLQKLIQGSLWDDTSTVWNSLGTITFPAAQSGTVIIKRIL